VNRTSIDSLISGQRPWHGGEKPHRSKWQGSGRRSLRGVGKGGGTRTQWRGSESIPAALVPRRRDSTWERLRTSGTMGGLQDGTGGRRGGGDCARGQRRRADLGGSGGGSARGTTGTHRSRRRSGSALGPPLRHGSAQISPAASRLRPQPSRCCATASPTSSTKSQDWKRMVAGSVKISHREEGVGEELV
jgi:hypothetical protein